MTILNTLLEKYASALWIFLWILCIIPVHKPNAILSIFMHFKCILDFGIWIYYLLILHIKYGF
jgi:hypothetical protein